MKSRRFTQSPDRRGASSVAGIARPSALAVLALIINSNLMGCQIGKSAGLALCCPKRWTVAPIFVWISPNQPVTASNEM
jgi:hypothetical protein